MSGKIGARHPKEPPMTDPADRLPPYAFRIRAACLVIILGCALAILNSLWGLIPDAWAWLSHLGIGLVIISSVYSICLARSIGRSALAHPSPHDTEC